MSVFCLLVGFDSGLLGLFPVCFLNRESTKVHGVGWWRDGEGLGGVGGGETVITTYSYEKIFQLKNK